MVPKNFKNYVLLFFSIVFYAWGELLYLPLLLISIFINYIFGLKIDKYQDDIRSKKRVLIMSIIFNILFLGVFKYTNFIVDNINILFNASINISTIPLPIGISFYTFQAMSYFSDHIYARNSAVNDTVLENLDRTKMNVLDVRTIMDSNKDLYYKTDHHWNMNGVYESYNYIINEMREKFP